MYEYNVGMIPEGGTMGDRTRIRIAINEALITFICQQGNRIGCKIIFVYNKLLVIINLSIKL